MYTVHANTQVHTASLPHTLVSLLWCTGTWTHALSRNTLVYMHVLINMHTVLLTDMWAHSTRMS